jgi:recombination protein RecR
MPKYPRTIENLIEEMGKLPGVGPKTAERYAFALLKRTRGDRERLAAAVTAPDAELRSCSTCHNLTETDPCYICADTKRERAMVCVVATEQDLLAVEHTGEFAGIYHILGGTLSAADGVTPDDLTIRELLGRVRREPPREILFAFDQTVEGEATLMYLARLLGPSGIQLTKLARGLPMGSELGYADELTLADALRDRRDLAKKTAAPEEMIKVTEAVPF